MATTSITFWKLLEEHNIEIPKIQRDYTYGRNDPKIEQIRRVFIEKLITHLKRDESLHLDFVYGRLVGLTSAQQAMENRRAIGGLLKSVLSYAETLDIKFEYVLTDTRNTAGAPLTTLLPLDGQQRLTTLFLLHWYVACRVGQMRERLIRFSYNTRKSAKDFCRELVEKGTVEDGAKGLAQAIKNNEWFFAGWGKDPTVSSMLAVLSEIHKRLRNEPTNTLSDIWARLTLTDKVTFSFLDTQRLLMTDELYVKMNARGKQLTDYENLKAWLQESYPKLPTPRWEQNLDTVWTDILWQYRKRDEFEIDNSYYKYFKEMALYHYAQSSVVVSELTDEQREITDALRSESYIPHSFLEEKHLFTQPVLEDTFLFLSLIENDGHRLLAQLLTRNLDGEHLPDSVKTLFGSKAIPKLWDRVFIHALIRFVTVKGKSVAAYDDIDKIQFIRWVRVASNLVYNTTIDNPMHLVQALQAIEQIAVHSANIYQYLTVQTNGVPFFEGCQVDEERIKCGLIIVNDSWEETLSKYELHSYFYGQVGFLIHFASVDSIPDIERFRFYAERAAVVFSDEILMRDDFLLQRALLGHHEYVIEINNNTWGLLLSRHGTLRLREENWRQYFAHTGHRIHFKRFLDLLDVNDIVGSLEGIVNASDADGWRQAMVKHPAVFSFCKEGRLQWPNEIDLPNLVMVLGSTKRSGYHAELYSYCFRLDYAGRLKTKFDTLKIEYAYVKGGGHVPYAYVGDWKIGDLNIYIGIYFYGKSYQLCVFDNDDQPIDSLTECMLKDRGYALSQSYYYRNIDEAEDCYRELETVCELFNGRSNAVVSENTVTTYMNT